MIDGPREPARPAPALELIIDAPSRTPPTVPGDPAAPCDLGPPAAAEREERAAAAGTRLGARSRWLAVGGAACGVVVVDQLTKYWARRLDEPIELIGSLRLNLAFNSGAAFSRFQGWGSVIGVVGIVVVAVLLRSSLSATSRIGAVCFGLVIGGALGNLIDRLVQPGPGLFGGKVTDFIDLQWWPIFNVADMALTCGGILLVLVGTVWPSGTGRRS